MKKTDLILLIIAFALAIFLIGKTWWIAVKLLLGILLIGMVLHWKISPFKTQLSDKYLKLFNLIDGYMQKILYGLKFIPKIQLGQHLQLDSAYIVLIIFTTTILILL